MAYKDLLVHVDESKVCAARVQAAVDLAAGHEAHLAGVYIIDDPSPATFAGAYVPPDLLDGLLQRARERAEVALARFAEVAARNRISFETRVDRVLYTEIADALATNARYADLAIVGQADAENPAAPRYLPEEVTLGSGRPSLVVPYIGAAPTLGQRVTVLERRTGGGARGQRRAADIGAGAGGRRRRDQSERGAVRQRRGARRRHRAASRPPWRQGRGLAHPDPRHGCRQYPPVPRRGPGQ